MRLGVYSTRYLHLAPPTIPLLLPSVTVQKHLSTWDKYIEQRSNALTTLRAMASQALTALLYSEFVMNTPTLNTVHGQFNYTPSTTPDKHIVEYLSRTCFMGFDANAPDAPYRGLDNMSLDLKVALAVMFRQACYELGDVVAGSGKCVRRWIASEEDLGHGKAIIAFTYSGEFSEDADELEGIKAKLVDYFDDLYADPMMVEGNTSII
jgi:hypothetical protein